MHAPLHTYRHRAMNKRGFQSLLMAGKYTADDNNSSPAEISDDSSMNKNMCYQPNSILSSHHYPYISSYDFFSNNNTGELSSQTFKKQKHIHSPEQFNFNPAIMFSHVPDLQSIEQMNQHNHRLKQSIIPANYFNQTPLQQIRPPAPAKVSVTDQARRRRNTLSDKTRSLQKVLPCEKKMDMATILEETFKYIKFLQAQVTVLESMPSNTIASNSGSNFVSENHPRYGNVNVQGELEKLNRKQLLEVVVNSPAAQTILYSKGCCVYSLEQLILIKDIAEKNFFFSDPSIFY